MTIKKKYIIDEFRKKNCFLINILKQRRQYQ